MANILPGQLTAVNGSVYFNAANEELWVSDGTALGTRVIEGIRLSSPNRVAFDGKLILDAVDFDHGEELWVSDGTSEGTRIVADLFPGQNSSSPYDLTVLNGALLFFARLANGSYGLFRMVSSSSAPVLVTAFSPVFIVHPLVPTGPWELTVAGSVAFFVASGDGKHTELWKTDGTREGTVPVKDITPGVVFSPFFSTAEQGRVFFDTSAGAGRQLWVSDGTSAGTIPLHGSPGLVPLGTFDGDFFFWAFESVSQGFVLWKTDGTAAGTISVRAFTDYSTLSVASRGGLLFAARDFDRGVELWKTDGTTGGTVIVRDIYPGSESSSPLNLTLIDGIVLFSAIDPDHGRELWRSDGSESGTFMIEDINPGSPSSRPGTYGFARTGDSILFGADGGPDGAGLWAIPISALGSEPRLRDRTAHELLFRR